MLKTIVVRYLPSMEWSRLVPKKNHSSTIRNAFSVDIPITLTSLYLNVRYVRKGTNLVILVRFACKKSSFHKYIKVQLVKK